MPRITIDTTKCDKDGLCARVCVARIISKPDKTHYPEIIPELAEFCLACGQCVAVCPKGALDHDLTPFSKCRPIDPEFHVDPGTIETLFKFRRSVRLYKDTPIPHDVFDRLMEVGRYAPTGGNFQDVRYLICDDRDRLKQMAEMVIDFMRKTVASGNAGYRESRLKRAILGWEEGHDTILRGAPALILIHSDTRNNPSQVNGIIAMSFMEVMAHVLGLGACYCGYFNNAANHHQPLIDLLGLPDGHSAAMTLLLGYPKVVYHRIPPRNPAEHQYL